jgi:hypothetical protein
MERVFLRVDGMIVDLEAVVDGSPVVWASRRGIFRPVLRSQVARWLLAGHVVFFDFGGAAWVAHRLRDDGRVSAQALGCDWNPDAAG